MTEADPEENTPLETATSEPENTRFYPGLTDLVVLVFSFIGYSLISIILVELILNPVHLNSNPLKLVLYVLPMLMVIYQSQRKAYKRQGYTSDFSFNKFPIWLTPLFIIGALALIVPISQIGNLMPMPDSIKKIFERAFTKDPFSVITLTLAAPIIEEILCRAIVLKGLLNNYSPGKAILVSSIFFGVLHLNPWQAIPACFGGMFMGWAYYKTRSVFPGTIIHATINGTSTLFLFLWTDNRQLWDILGTTYYLLVLVGSIAVFSLICVLINKKMIATTEFYKEKLQSEI